MPRILLLGPSDETVSHLTDLGFAITVGAHGERVTPGAPSPTDWDLILHIHCETPSKQQREAGLLEVDDKYLAESLAPEVCLGWGKSHYDIQRARVEGYRAFEALPGSERFHHVVDFFEDQEERLTTSLFMNLGSRDFQEVLATNQYGQVVMGLTGPELKVLATIPPQGREGEPSIVRHLLGRTLPKLFPKAYWDTFVPEKVRALQDERGRVIEERRRLVRDIDQVIQQELEFFSPFSVLPRLRDDKFKETLGKVLSEFGFLVTDIDEGKEFKDSDLMVQADGLRGFIEAKSSGNRNCSSRHIEDFERNIEKSREHHGHEDFRVLIFNGQVDVPDAGQSPTFDKQRETEAEISNMGLATGRDLLAALEAMRSGRLAPEDIRSHLRRSGIISFVG